MSAPGPETHWGLYAHKWDDSMDFIDWFETFAGTDAVCKRMYKADEKDGKDDRTIKTFVVVPPSYGEVIG